MLCGRHPQFQPGVVDLLGRAPMFTARCSTQALAEARLPSFLSEFTDAAATAVFLYIYSEEKKKYSSRSKI